MRKEDDGTSLSLDEAKKQLRQQSAMIRQSAFAARPNAAHDIARFHGHLTERYAPKIIAAYWPIRTEIDPIPLLGNLCADGALSCLPVTPEEGKPLIFHEWRIGTELASGPYNTKEPFGTTPIVKPDLILAPLLAFDAACWRLGYGGGFYDRTLAALEADGHQADVVGIAFDESEVEKVPTGPYDRVLSAILTPTNLRLPRA